MLVTTPPAQAITRCPKLKRSTRKAKVTCRPSPQAMVRQRMCLRSVETEIGGQQNGENSQYPRNRPKRLLLLCGSADELHLSEM